MTSTNALRTRWAAVGAAVAVTLGAVGLGSMNIASADISSGDRPVYVPIDGCRLIDTRSNPDFNVGDKNTPFGPDQTLTIAAHGSNGNCGGPTAIPTDAVGLALNVTAVGASIETYLTVWGEGADPGTSALNPSPGQAPTPNAVNTPLSAIGTFNIRNNLGTVDVIVDIAGYYAGHDHDDRYVIAETEGRLVLDGPVFSPLFEGGGWRFGDEWRHSPIAGLDCLAADVDLPVGTVIESMTVHHRAESPVFLESGLSEAPSGPDSASDPSQKSITSYTGPVTVTSGDTYGSVDVPLVTASPVVRLGYSQTVFVCVIQAFTLGSVAIEYSIPR